MRVLVVDDTTVTRKCTAITLQHLGFEVEEAADGPAAVAKFQSSGYDAVLMDFTLPGMSGVECTKRMRSYEAENGGKRAAIIAMTAHEVERVRPACQEAGMDDCINKLCDSMSLKKLLMQWIESDK